MPNNKIDKNCDLNQYCNNVANQYLILVSIYASIISQEIENDEDLGILGSFLVALGEEIALASEMRIACKSKFEESNSDSEEVEDVFDRGIHKNNVHNKRYKKIKKKTPKNKKWLISKQNI